jgi:putative endonuclease
MRTRRSYCVYIVGSISGTLYIAVTGNLHKRVFEHKFHRIGGFTDEYDVERLLYWESYDDVRKAIGREKQLKGLASSEEDRLDRVDESTLAGFEQGVVPVDEGL